MNTSAFRLPISLLTDKTSNGIRPSDKMSSDCEQWLGHKHDLIKFFLNVSLNSLNLATTIFVITAKGLEHATSCVRDQDATIALARH